MPVHHNIADIAASAASAAPASTPGTLVTTATSQPALGTGFVMLGLASLLGLSKVRNGGGADRMLAMSGAAAAGWYLVESRRRH